MRETRDIDQELIMGIAIVNQSVIQTTVIIQTKRASKPAMGTAMLIQNKVLAIDELVPGRPSTSGSALTT